MAEKNPLYFFEPTLITHTTLSRTGQNEQCLSMSIYYIVYSDVCVALQHTFSMNLNFQTFVHSYLSICVLNLESHICALFLEITRCVWSFTEQTYENNIFI